MIGWTGCPRPQIGASTMRIKSIIVTAVLAVAAIAAVSSTQGCSQAQTRKSADRFGEAGTKAIETAVKIENALEKYNAGIIEEGVFVDMILAWVDDEKRVLFQSWIDIGTEVRVAAEDIAASLRVTAQSSFDEEVRLDAKADANESKWENFGSIVQSVASVALQPEGVVIAALTGLLGLTKRGERKAKTEASENADLARRASNAASEISGVAQNLVHGLEVLKSTDMGREAWETVGRKAVVASQTPEAIAFVKSVKSKKAASPTRVAFEGTVPRSGTQSETPPTPSSDKPSTPPAPGPEHYDGSGDIKK